MKYINKKTGGTIDTPFKVSGGDWGPFAEFDQKKSEELGETNTGANTNENTDGNSETGQKNTGNEDLDNVTIAEIKQELDALGIKYKPTARKAELYALMMEGA